MNKYTLEKLQCKGLEEPDRFRCQNSYCQRFDYAVYVKKEIVKTSQINCRSCNRPMHNFGHGNFGRYDIGDYTAVDITTLSQLQ